MGRGRYRLDIDTHVHRVSYQETGYNIKLTEDRNTARGAISCLSSNANKNLRAVPTYSHRHHDIAYYVIERYKQVCMYVPTNEFRPSVVRTVLWTEY